MIKKIFTALMGQNLCESSLKNIEISNKFPIFARWRKIVNKIILYEIESKYMKTPD